MRLKIALLSLGLLCSSVTWAEDFTGTYISAKSKSELLLKKQGRQYQFSLLAFNGHNSGGLTGVVTFVQNKATFVDTDYSDCRLNLIYVESQIAKAKPNIMVTQHGSSADCGFGLNVFADGDYRLVNKSVDFSSHHLGH